MIKLLSILALIMCTSCTQGGDNNQKSTSQELILKDTIAYSYQNHMHFSPYFVEHNGNIDTAYYKITYPIFEDKYFNDAVHSFILIDGDQNIESAAESFILGYNEFVEESSTETINFPWFKNVTSQVWVNTPRVMTLATAVDEFTGGAHGIHYTVLSNFDVAMKKKIELEDIVRKEKLADLTKLAEKHFRKNENLSDTASLQKKFFFENGIFAINDNFALTNSGLIFFYNEYEIRPYADGPTLLKIPYSDIASILNPLGQQYVSSIQESLN